VSVARCRQVWLCWAWTLFCFFIYRNVYVWVAVCQPFVKRIYDNDVGCIITSLVSLQSNFINRPMSTMWFIVCWWQTAVTEVWCDKDPFVQTSMAWALACVKTGRVWWGRSKSGCQIAGSHTRCWLTTEADNQSSSHCEMMSTEDVSSHIGWQDPSCSGGWSTIYVCSGQCGWVLTLKRLSDAAFWRSAREQY